MDGEREREREREKESVCVCQRLTNIEKKYICIQTYLCKISQQNETKTKWLSWEIFILVLSPSCIPLMGIRRQSLKWMCLMACPCVSWPRYDKGGKFHFHAPEHLFRKGFILRKKYMIMRKIYKWLCRSRRLWMTWKLLMMNLG